MEYEVPPAVEWVFVANPTLEWIAAGLMFAAAALIIDMVVHCDK